MSDLPPGWALATLGDVCLPVSKVDPRRAPHDRFAYIDIGGIDGLRIVSTKSVLGAEAPSRARQLVHTGDTVLSTVRTYLRKTALVGADLDGAVASTGFCVLRPAALDPRYLFHRVTAHNFVARITQLQTGSSYPAVRDRDVFAQSVEVPPLNEQRRIVAAIEEHLSRLDAADASLASAARRLSPFRDDTYEAENRIGWAVRPLGELLREPLRNGHSAKAASDGSIRTLTLSAVTRREFTDANTKLTSADPKRVEALWLEPGDLLIERSNTPELVGTAALYKGRRNWAIFPDLLIRVRVGDAVLPEFVEVVLRARSARRHFQRAAQGIAGSMPKIGQGAVERLEVPVPPLSEQRRIVQEVEERLSAIDALHAAIARAQRRSAALRRAVLERAFRGELVPQDPSDEPAEALLARIRAQRDTSM